MRINNMSLKNMLRQVALKESKKKRHFNQGGTATNQQKAVKNVRLGEPRSHQFREANYMRLVSLIKNKRLRYYLFLSCFTGCYLFSILNSRRSENEVVRIGAAGSITTLIGESSFYFIDAINARSKVLSKNVGFMEMLRDVLKNEGVQGLFKGYSACYYSSIMYGYLYFYIYKGFKGYIKDTDTFR
jgi:hypothetical protein